MLALPLQAGGKGQDPTNIGTLRDSVAFNAKEDEERKKQEALIPKAGGLGDKAYILPPITTPTTPCAGNAVRAHQEMARSDEANGGHGGTGGDEHEKLVRAAGLSGG